MIQQTKKGELFEAEMLRFRKIRHLRSWEDVRALTTIGSINTLGKYIKDPDLIPIGSLLEIFDALKVPADNRREILEMLTK